MGQSKGKAHKDLNQSSCYPLAAGTCRSLDSCWICRKQKVVSKRDLLRRGPHEEGRNQTGHNETDTRDRLPVETATAAATCRLAAPSYDDGTKRLPRGLQRGRRRH
eukprot:2046100-Rhodomonas_salina.3